MSRLAALFIRAAFFMPRSARSPPLLRHRNTKQKRPRLTPGPGGAVCVCVWVGSERSGDTDRANEIFIDAQDVFVGFDDILHAGREESVGDT